MCVTRRSSLQNRRTPLCPMAIVIWPVKFVTSGSGFHATNPQAAIYWNPGNTASGNYSLKGTFTLVKPSGHASSKRSLMPRMPGL